MVDGMKIYEVPETRRYWLVRADGGKYYNHFTSYGLIGLGHIDFLGDDWTYKNVEASDIEAIRQLLVVNPEKGKSRRGQSHYTQVRSFVADMNVGDWVLTVGTSSIRFGRVVSGAFFDPKVVELPFGPEGKYISEMKLFLRRHVVWGPQISRSRLPYGLARSLKANQSLVSLDKNWQAIYHTLYPFFVRGNNLYLSTKINSEEDISNYDISVLFSIISELEVIGKSINDPRLFDDFDSVFNEYVLDKKLTATAKAQFYSPGDIWTMISGWTAGLPADVPGVILAYSMLFGNEKLGFSGVVDLETRKKLWDLVIDRLKKRRSEDVVDKLKLDSPSEDTESIEDDSKDRK